MSENSVELIRTIYSLKEQGRLVRKVFVGEDGQIFLVIDGSNVKLVDAIALLKGRNRPNRLKELVEKMLKRRRNTSDQDTSGGPASLR
jgi:hypothetical protein